MDIKKISYENLLRWVDVLIGEQKVIGVQAKAGEFDFLPLERAADLRLDYDVTLQPPRKCFQPPVERLVNFNAEGRYESSFAEEKFIIIGVHPYDMVAINQMDKIWAADFCDEHYFARRRCGTIIVVDVARASKNVFASSLGFATVKEGFDVLLTDVGSGFVAEAGSEKGREVLGKAEGAAASDGDIEWRRKVWRRNEEMLNKHPLRCKPSDLPRLLEKSYKHPVWEEKAATCFSCGSCNQVCPTCYCFNVRDDVGWDLKSGGRERVWDGCLLDGFTKVAGGHEFRKKRAERFRHRIFRKGWYVPMRIGGEIACVGCGRCVGACLPDIANPVKIYNRLVEDIGI